MFICYYRHFTSEHMFVKPVLFLRELIREICERTPVIVNLILNILTEYLKRNYTVQSS